MADDAKTKAEAPVVDESPEVVAKKKKKKLILMAIIGSIVLLSVAGGAFFVLSKGKANQNEEEISKDGAAKGDEKDDSKHADANHDEKKHETTDSGKEKAAAEGDKKEDAPGAKKADHGDGKVEGKASDSGAATGDGKGEAKGEEKSKGQEKESESNIDFGETYKMQTFNLNLGNALENRYLRIEISLEYRGGGDQKKEIEKRLPQLRDAIIGIMQRKTREFLLSPDGKESLRKELLIRINRYMTKKIESVYITDLLIE